MTRRLRVNVFCSGIMLATWVALAAFAQLRPQAVHEIRMTARKYQFDPAVINVHEGERVKLIITALDRDHGFALPAFGINQKLKKGVPTTVEFTANRAGTFPFHCSVVCGLGHRRMKGKLVVTGGGAVRSDGTIG